MNHFYLLLFFSLNHMLFAHEYYSQCGQDRFLYERYFRHQKNGIFVDVGAHDGKTYSNSYFFEKHLGWKGICIEPQPDIFELLKQNRNCILVNKCISAQIGIEDFLLIHNGGIKGEYTEMLSGIYATMHPYHLERIKREILQYGGSFEIVKIPSTTLSQILDEYAIHTVDYLSIDTEGSELMILKTIDFEKCYIRFISIENNYASPDIRAFLISKGFRYLTILDRCDEIYCNGNEHFSLPLAIQRHV